jgi:hypothetical protein
MLLRLGRGLLVAAYAFLVASLLLFSINWLRVLDTAASSQVNQRVGHQLHAIMPLLDAFKSE